MAYGTNLEFGKIYSISMLLALLSLCALNESEKSKSFLKIRLLIRKTSANISTEFM